MGEFIQQYEPAFWAILGIAVTLIVTLIAIPRRKIDLEIITNNLIGNIDIGNIKLSYNNQEVNVITVTKVIFKNIGNRTIRKNDIASNNPIRFYIKPDYEILDIKVVDSSSEDNCSKINKTLFNEKDKKIKSYTLDFEYFEKKEGCIIQIVHTAPNNDSIFTRGKVIDGNKIRTNFSPSNKFLFLVCAILTAFLAIISAIFGLNKPIYSITTFYIIMAIILASFATNFWNKTFYRLPKNIKNVFHN